MLICQRSLIRSTHFRVTGLQEGLEYEFRVFAENAAGISKHSRPSQGVFAHDPVDVPVNIEVIDIRYKGQSLVILLNLL